MITENSAKMLPVNHCSAIDKLLDYVPDIMDKMMDICSKNKTYTYEFYEDVSDDEDNRDNKTYPKDQNEQNENANESNQSNDTDSKDTV